MKQLCVLQGFLPINQKKVVNFRIRNFANQCSPSTRCIRDLSNFSTIGKRLHYLFKMKLELTNP